MVSTPEGAVKIAIKAYLKTLPYCWWFLPVSNGMGTMGIPDIICCYKGWFFAIECKAPGKSGNTTKLQDMQLTAIRDARGFSIVAEGVDDVRWAIEVLDQFPTVRKLA
jgi:hypothetical protein